MSKKSSSTSQKRPAIQPNQGDVFDLQEDDLLKSCGPFNVSSRWSRRRKRHLHFIVAKTGTIGSSLKGASKKAAIKQADRMIANIMIGMANAGEDTSSALEKIRSLSQHRESQFVPELYNSIAVQCKLAIASSTAVEAMSKSVAAAVIARACLASRSAEFSPAAHMIFWTDRKSVPKPSQILNRAKKILDMAWRDTLDRRFAT